MTNLSKEAQIELLKDIFGFMASLLRESERAAVILAAARIDIDLETLLKHVLHRHPGGADPLFDSDRTLGTFSAKIALSHRLGILSQDFEHVLQMLRKMRNDFAHQLEDESLASVRQKPRLNELIKWAKSSSIYHTFPAMHPPEGKTPEHLEFVACAICMASLLKTGLRTLKRVNVGTALTL